MEWVNAADTAMAEWGRSLGYASESFVRLLLAMICGAAVGIERQLRGREAGFRTHALVCMGSALVMVVSVHFAFEKWEVPPIEKGVEISIDPSRIAYGVMTGIGFLGAGSILKHNGSIQGLTTAAGLWCVAAIGLAAGFGQYGVTILATLLVVLTLWVLEYFGQLFPNLNRYIIMIRRPWQTGCVKQTTDRVKSLGVDVFDVYYSRDDKSPDSVDIRLAVTMNSRWHHRDLEADIERDGIHRVMSVDVE